MELLLKYFPLLQSLIGALGALGVAVCTVALTNQHTRKREEEKDRRARHLERVADLKDRLDACIDLVATAFRMSSGSARRAIVVASEDGKVKPPLPHDVPTDDHFALMNEAITRAELHFPTLVDPLKALSTALMAMESISSEGTAAAYADPGKWKKTELGPYVARFQLATIPAIDRRQEAINEARRLLTHDFDLLP